VNPQTAAVDPAMHRQPLPLPKVMHFNLTDACNLNCIICRPEDFRYKAQYLDRPLIERVIAEAFDSLEELRLDSSGELLMARDLPFVLEEATRRRIPTKICTNGMLIKDEQAEMICRSSVTNVQISFDSPDQETLEWIRTRAKFDRVIAGAETLVKWRDQVGSSLRINFHAAVMRQNLEQLPDLIRLAKRIGVDDVSFAYGFIHEHMDPEWAVFWDQNRYREVMREVRWLCDDLGVGYNAPPDFGTQVLASRRCDYLFEKTYVNPSGIVAPCCIAPDGSIGSLHEHSLSAIWHGDTYQALRDTYDTATPAFQKCGACYIMQGWNPDDFKPHFHPSHYPYVEARLRGETPAVARTFKAMPVTMTLFERDGEGALRARPQTQLTLQGKRVVIFGAGAGGRDAAACLDASNIGHSVVAVCDNDPAKQGTAFGALTVQAFDELRREDYDFIIIASLTGKAPIRAQLEAAGLTLRTDFGTLAFVMDYLLAANAA